MLLFRSEEHLERWLRERSLNAGARMSVQQQWDLARVWYAGRLDADWRRRSPQEAQDVFASVGLKGEFWQLVR
jgi:hypothetical protein